MTDIHIPAAALEAGAKALYEKWCALHGVTYLSLPWEEVEGEEREFCIAEARASFLGIVKAWPDMAHRVMPYAAIIIPLTEKPDEQ